MTNQLSKSTRGRIYTRALEIGGRPTQDSIIAHALDIEDRLKVLLKLAEQREEKCITIAEIYAILQK
jgi:hypothetical protein